MFSAVQGWLGRVPTADPYERRTAMAVQVFCIGLSVLLLANEAVDAWRGTLALDLRTAAGVAADVLSALFSIAAVVLIRRGRIRPGYALVLGGYVAILSLSIMTRGLEYHRIFLVRVIAILFVFAALLLGRRALWTTFGALLAAMLVGHLRDLGQLGGHGPMQPREPSLGIWGQAIVVMLLFSVVLDRFGAALAEAYAVALGRQREAERTARELRLAKESLESEMERRVHAEALLLQSQKLEAIGRLSGGVAHDFNNLLTAILGFTQLSHHSLPPEDPRRKDLEIVMHAAQRGAGLTQQLLAFARRQAGEPRAIMVEDRVRALEPMLRRLIGEQVTIELDLDVDPRRVRMDPGQLEQVLVNLCVNARDAMPRGGKLRIETSHVLVSVGIAAEALGLVPGEHVRLLVSDTGEGMDEATLASVFEPFFTTKALGQGTGLGLATCFGLVRQAGGAITAASSPGRGATFTVLLPTTQAAPTIEAATSRPPASSGSATILVVEDDAHVRDLVERVLREHGHQVLVACDAVAAEALVRDHLGDLDLLLTDVRLPGSDGLQLADHLAQMRPGLVALYMSGHADDIIARHGLAGQGMELLAKPFTPELLIERVRDLLDARGAIRR